ncbi:MAG: tetratricopeptide repeat-containing sensor histidine kinase [Melioribacteraceae bacterium]|nr:tetratricopeptide repeat-containing sensor histidine kinase [Melioribacteraceae bacterium]
MRTLLKAITGIAGFLLIVNCNPEIRTQKIKFSAYDSLYQKAFEVTESNPDSGRILILSAIDIAESEGYSFDKAEAFLLLGRIYNRLSQQDSALILLSKCEAETKKFNNDTLLAKVFLEKGLIEENLGNYKNTIREYEKALGIYKGPGRLKDEANILNRIGVAYKYMSDYPAALKYHYEALRIYEEINYIRGEASALGNIANVNEALKDYPEALKIYLKVLGIFKELNDEDKAANTYMNIGVINYYMKDYDKALDNFFSAKQLLEKLNNDLILAYTLNNIASVYEAQNNISESIVYFGKALDISRKLNNRWSLANTLNNIGSTKIKSGQLNSALNYVNEALQIASQNDLKNVKLESYLHLHEIHSKNEEYKKALDYYKLHKEMNDSIFSTEKQKLIAEMNAKYETEKKEKEIQDYLIDEQRQIIFFSLFVAGLLLVIAVINYMLYRTKRRSHDFLTTVIDSLTNPFCVFNVVRNNIELINKAALKSDSPYHPYIKTDRNNRIKLDYTPYTYENVLAAKSPFAKEVAYSIDEDNIQYYEFYGFPFIDKKGNVERIIEYAINITDKKQAIEKIQSAFKREKELNELKSQFISSTSHEFRTPLATLYSSVELIQHYDKTNSESKKKYHIDRIKSIVKFMTRMLDDILTINRAETNKLEFEPEKINLRSLCNEIFEDVMVTASENHFINQEYEIENSMLSIDSKLIRQILTNLLSNAIKYSPDGGQIKFRTEIENDQIKFTIRDEGIGIPKKNYKNLFQHFYRASNVGSISGAGLGLAIVKKSVEVYKGTIEFESEVGKGTTFIVKLPLN